MPDDHKRTETILLLPTLIEDLKKQIVRINDDVNRRVENVEKESMKTQIIMAKMEEKQHANHSLLKEIAVNMKSHDAFMNKAKGMMFAVGSVGGIIGSYVHKFMTSQGPPTPPIQ